MPLGIAPRLPYRQPEALCRSLVYTWAGELLTTSHTESAIMAGLVTKAQVTANSPEYRGIKSNHKTSLPSSANPKLSVTVAYSHAFDPQRDHSPALRARGHMVEVDPDAKGEGTRSIAKNVLRAFGSHMSFQGKTLIDLAASTNAKIGKAVTAAISPLWTVGGQTAMCVSLHYDYGAINGNLASSSAHSVGFMHSPGGLGNRQAGFRFFDPNVGSWRFNKVTELTMFFTNDWIRNFIDNTMTADPPRPGQSTTWKGPRSITGFRLIQFVLV